MRNVHELTGKKLSTRLYSSGNYLTVDAAKAIPVNISAVGAGEAGKHTTQMVVELQPVAGKLMSSVYANVTKIFLPYEALDYYLNPTEAMAGTTERCRQLFESKDALFNTLVVESDITKTARLLPSAVGGVKKVNQLANAAYNLAVSHMAKRLTYKAEAIADTNLVISPTVIGQTVLKQLGGVLEPDPDLNGDITVTSNTLQVPVKGIALQDSSVGAAPYSETVRETGETSTTTITGWKERGDGTNTSTGARAIYEQDPDNLGYPKIVADMEGLELGTVSLADFYEAERLSTLTSYMDKIVRDDPVTGIDRVLRWAHGLNIAANRRPVVLYDRRVEINRRVRTATDGANLDVRVTDSAVSIKADTFVPRTELGGIVVTIVSVTPEEVISEQPDPFLSKVIQPMNYAADALEINPDPVTFAELDSNVAQADESTVAFYVKHNGMKEKYRTYGLSPMTDLTSVWAKNALWQYEVPLSVTGGNVYYPASLSTYPFVDQAGPVASVTSATSFLVASPIIYGPRPVERVTELDDIQNN